MALHDNFKLAKLEIEALDAPAQAEPFVAMFNPSTLSMSYGNVFENEFVLRGEGDNAKWVRKRSKSLSITLILDGTGVTDYGIDTLTGRGSASVAEQIDDFLATCYHNGDSGAPNRLRIKWGAGPLRPGYECVLEGVEISYSSFDRDGSPLRAELGTTFRGAVNPSKAAAKDRKSTKMLSAIQAVAGDTLPGLCKRLLGSQAHHLSVARANGIDHPRELEPGRTLVFPPPGRPK